VAEVQEQGERQSTPVHRGEVREERLDRVPERVEAGSERGGRQRRERGRAHLPKLTSPIPRRCVVKLYVCYGTFKSPRPGGHPCGNAYRALKEAGHEPEVVKTYGWGALPDALNTGRRKEVKALSGNTWVPVLVTDDESVVSGSKEIVAWAQEHPAAAPATA
jgi:hypothetical protein